jgi:UDP:flavonoid glycosyltransferase YjiC (YdhE family)
MGPLANRLSHHLVSELAWAVNRGWVNDWRRSLGLESLSVLGPITTRFFREKRSVLCAVSPSVIPLPGDWPETARITGYLFAPPDLRSPPPDLVDFLAAGPPPVCVTFGSTVEIQAGALLPILTEAQRRTGRRFVYVKGWANYDLPAPSRDVFIVERASYPWLFARSLAVVHHAGTGTAAEVVRAGVPSVCVPHITEQRFWSTRLTALGVAPPQIPRRDLSASRLAEAIECASSPEMRERTRALGAKVQAEDGVAKALEVIESVVLRSSKTHAASTTH